VTVAWQQSAANDWYAEFSDGWTASLQVDDAEVWWLIRSAGNVRDQGVAPRRSADPEQTLVRRLVEVVVATLQAIEQQAPAAPEEDTCLG
jgi:hypothetical protein